MDDNGVEQIPVIDRIAFKAGEEFPQTLESVFAREMKNKILETK